MQARLILTAALAVLLLCLTWLAWSSRARPQSASVGRSISEIKADTVTNIVIDRADNHPIELQKSDEEWQLVKPLTARANPIKVNNLLRFLEAKSDMPADVNLSDLTIFGLAQPAVTISFNSIPFALGDANPLTGKRYIKFSDRVYTSTDSIYHDVLADPASFASLNLLSSVQEPQAIQLPDHRLQRNGGKWNLIPPIAGITGDQLIGIVNAWRHAQAHAVKSLHGSAHGPTITIEYDDATPIKFHLRSLKPELVLECESLGLAYHLFAAQADRLLLLPDNELKASDRAPRATGNPVARDGPTTTFSP